MASPPFDRIDHRPWPIGKRPWVVRFIWEDLLFAHWPLPEAALRPLVPPAVELDLFDDRAWVGVVPFRMRNVRVRGLPPVPGTAAFPELNVRTYVRAAGTPGGWFFSLDAESAPVVWIARRWFHLPYYNARAAGHLDAEAGRLQAARSRARGREHTSRCRELRRRRRSVARSG